MTLTENTQAVPDQSSRTALPTIKIDGSTVDAQKSHLERVIIQDALHLPDMLELWFRDPKKASLTDSGAGIGKAVVVETTTQGTHPGVAKKVFHGEITSIEGEYGGDGERIIVRALDKSHRLHHGTRTCAYIQKTDGDIAREIAARHGLGTGTIDQGILHEHIAQLNLSDWEFIKARARELGYEAGVREDKLYFSARPINEAAPQGATIGERTDMRELTYGDNLREFHPRVGTAALVGKAVVRGWDMKQKQVVQGEETVADSGPGFAGPQLAQGYGPAALKGKIPGASGAEFAIKDRSLFAQSAAKAVATGAAKQITSSVGEADGLCEGNPGIRAGASVTVKGVSDPFNGKWTVTATRHAYDGQSYRTYLTVGGRQERSALGLASLGSSGGSPAGPPMFGFVIGVVTNNDDPDKLYRVKVKYPVYSDQMESDWIRMAQVFAGTTRGAAFVPEVNDEVLIGFVNGDTREPVVMGALYNGKDKPKEPNPVIAGGKVTRRGFHSRKGHQIQMFDECGSEDGIQFVSADGNLTVKVDQKNKTVDITSNGGGTINLKSQGDMTLKSDANITIEAMGKLTAKGTGGAELTSPAQTVIKGSMVNIN